MKNSVRFVGLDVHAETIAVAVAEASGEVRDVGIIANRPEAVRKLVAKLGPVEHIRACYEAGPTGYGVYWQLVKLGIACEVIAPTLIPSKPGERIKTDRRDAAKLARCHRAGDLTAVWVPDKDHEALRDLVRQREAGIKDRHRARQRFGKFLLRHGCNKPEKMTRWTQKYMAWIKTLRFEQFGLMATLEDHMQEIDHINRRVERLDSKLDEAIALAPPETQEVIAALQALRGVAKLTAATVVTELGQLNGRRAKRSCQAEMPGRCDRARGAGYAHLGGKPGAFHAPRRDREMCMCREWTRPCRMSHLDVGAPRPLFVKYQLALRRGELAL